MPRVKSFRQLPLSARRLVGTVGLLGISGALLALAFAPPAIGHGAALFVGLALFAGFVKVPLPVAGSLSLAYTFVFATLMGFGLGASVLAGVLSAFGSGGISRIRGHRPRFYRTCFNAGLIGLTSLVAGLAYLLLGGRIGTVSLSGDLLPILGYTAVFSVVNVGLISLAIHLSGEDRGGASLEANFRWSVPGYLAGSALATLLNLLLASDNLGLLLLGAPFVYLIHLSHRARTERLEEERRHTQQTAELYAAVTEALALAVEAKDENTEDHLQRVRQFSIRIGEILQLPPDELEALRAASLLHDIGKIAIPEYILTKPGKLTADEMEIMRTHPVVGAEILSRVPFPYPLAPIVRHHHERWDGTGYPDGLRGEEIPRGARILTVVDCYDALTTDRPYRKRMPREEALAFLRHEAGVAFDPEIIEVLGAHLDELEHRVWQCELGGAHPAGEEFQSPSADRDIPAERRREKESLEALTEAVRRLGPEPDRTACLETLAERLGDLVPYRSCVLYVLDKEKASLSVTFAAGHARDKLGELTIPVGERPAGWAALHQRPYVGERHRTPLERDGSRSDLEDLFDDEEVAELRSSLVVPMTTERGRLGVLALYHSGNCPYTKEQVELVGRAAHHFARVLEFQVQSASAAGDETASLHFS